MPAETLVSVIIPTYFRNDYLTECLERVGSQSYGNIEVIVVDDSGEGNAENVVQEVGVENTTYIAFEENKGPTKARNKGIEAASGEYIQLLDDDDFLRPRKIEKQVEIFGNNPDIGVVYCGFDAEGQEVRPEEGQRGDVLKETLRFDLHSCITSTMLTRARFFEDMTPLPETPGSDDTYWKIELANMTDFGFVDEVLVDRCHPPDQRGRSFGAVEGTYNVLEEYRGLYDQFDERVYKRARSRAIGREAVYLAKTNFWSPRAVFLAIKSLRTDPSPDITSYITPFAFSLGKLSLVPSKLLLDKMRS